MLLSFKATKDPLTAIKATTTVTIRNPLLVSSGKNNPKLKPNGNLTKRFA